jgi:hypothetical protein
MSFKKKPLIFLTVQSYIHYETLSLVTNHLCLVVIISGCLKTFFTLFINKLAIKHRIINWCIGINKMIDKTPPRNLKIRIL